MVEWLKYFFLSFFSNKTAKDGIKRSFGNAALSMVLSFIIICLGLFVGYIATFSYHYSRSDEFRGFVYSAFAENTSSRIGLSVSGGKLSAAIPGGKNYANSIETPDSVYKKNGYELFVDDRPLDTYVEFAIAAKNKQAGEADITYDEYVALSADDKKNYTLKLTAGCVALDVNVAFDEYKTYLDGVSVEGADGYDKKVAEQYEKLYSSAAEGKITTEEYKNSVYELYIKTRYSAYDFSDRGVPALYWYYADYSASHPDEKYLMLLYNACIISFESSTGLEYILLESYDKVGNVAISAAGMSESDAKANVDKFISDLFASGYANAFFTYLMSGGRVALYYLIAILLFALALFFVARKLKCLLLTNVTDALKLTASFMLMPALLAFVVSILFSLFMTRTAVFNLAGILFIVIVAARTLCAIIPEIIRDRKEAENDTKDDTAADGEYV